MKTNKKLPLTGLIAFLHLLSAAGLPADSVNANRGQLDIPTYPWAAGKHPYFRGTDKVNIYPYPMLDFLSRDKTNRTYRTVMLENDYLRITFLPELGGKIHEVIDKTTGQPMFYVNHVIKPGLIGQCGAWTSGGVEWNTGPQGHTVGCMQPVAVEILPPEKDGARSVAIGETERIYGTHWTVVVTLRPGRSFIEERIRIYNPTEAIRPYYFWNCTAMPNTPGFRFIYPMTLGTDHGSEKFFDWPIDHGKDLSRGTNYQDASSIFAWHCDQDFFGSYDDGADRGVVSYANHHQVPGKKAWTWGQGGFGRMHQMDLTDKDGPYNEVQTGPLLTQGEVGRLDPCEAVEWNEWWYPVHGLGGFTFANKNVAVNASRDGTNLTLRVLGTGAWKSVAVTTWVPRLKPIRHPEGRRDVSAQKAIEFEIDIGHVGKADEFFVELASPDEVLARFRVPLDLPKREPPAAKPQAETPSELAQAGWQDYLFARFPEAENHFRKALEKDPKCVTAHTGLAFVNLDPDRAAAARSARAALETQPDCGLAHYALAVALSRSESHAAALDEAWKSSLDPVTAAAGRALVASIHLRAAEYRRAVEALSDSGPWQADPLCRNRLALALFRLNDTAGAVRLANENLRIDPLDTFARSILWMAKAEKAEPTLAHLLDGNTCALLDLAAEHAQLSGGRPAPRLLEEFGGKQANLTDAMAFYWQAWEYRRQIASGATAKPNQSMNRLPAEGVFPSRVETIPILRDAFAANPFDAKAALYLGHLLFSLGRHAEGRAMWEKAADIGAESVIAYRALGMAAKTLDNDLKAARAWLEKASQADARDAIVARDLANVLSTLADKAGADAEKRALTTEARDRLKVAFSQGRGRSDFVALLARTQNRLGDYADTARMLDSVRVTVWEGAHEVHDLFEEAHLALGEAQLKAGHPAEALTEFNRALEYPENLATGRLENAPEARIHYLRGNALLALGQKDKAVETWKKAVAAPSTKDERHEQARKKAQAALEQAAK